MSKQYGLILPGKSNVSAPVLQKPSIFDDSDSDTETRKPTGFTKNVKRQDRLMQQQALAEDPTVFQYDELYDDMDTKRKESKLVRKDLDKKPKYISRLLQTAERRKRENERRIERQVQKEREEEGNQFKDKEEFVTTAYRKKLEELKELEEAEKREEYLESIGDVRKQGDLSGFYRHLYDQKVNYEDKKEDEEAVKVEVKAEEQSRSPSPHETEEKTEKPAPEKKKTAKRKYRKRDESASGEEEEEETKKLEHLPSNLDADSDFSIDSDDSEGEEASKKKQKIKEEAVEEAQETKEEEKGSSEKKTEENKAEVPSNGTAAKEEDEVKKEEETKEEKVEEEKKKPKINIWQKRTVGDVFDEALQRYFQRKALREVQIG